jgi:energy-converting hydrogenase Eha subunit A
MKPTLNDKVITYLVLISGLAISGVAEYYSIMGLIAIYPAAFWPIVIMGVVLGLGKITGTVWLKQNWEYSPWFLKTYILPAIVILMMITSLGVFGFLSKAHSDQNLVSGDIQAKIAVYDEKIKTSKENIDANRKALKQMDEAVDQVMGRSTSETGADKAVGIRRAQQKERARLQSEIAAEQKTISQLSEERAPVAAEVRKVEAEVGPIKYIAHLLYGENPDANILEKAVIWVTVLIVIVLDPLAVILLLASQFSFQRFREQEEEQAVKDWFDQGKERARQLDQERNWLDDQEDELNGSAFVDPNEDMGPSGPEPHYEPDDGPITEQQYEAIIADAKEHLPSGEITTSTTLFPSYQILDDDHEPDHIETWNRMIEEAEKEIVASQQATTSTVTHTEDSIVIEDSAGTAVIPNITVPEGYVQNEEQNSDSTKWKEISNVTESTYLETARAHMINTFAEQVINKTIEIDSLPDDIKGDVAHQVSHIQDVVSLQRKEEMISSLAKQVGSGLIPLDQIPDNYRNDVQAKLDAQ